MRENTGRTPNAYTHYPEPRQTRNPQIRNYNQDQELYDERCECGNLLCKIKFGEYVEIKCRRCKRLHYIKIKKLRRETQEIDKHLWENAITQENVSKTVISEETMYVSLKNSIKFHHPDCRWAKNINLEYRITFKSRNQAIEEGYEPCGVCMP